MACNCIDAFQKVEWPAGYEGTRLDCTLPLYGGDPKMFVSTFNETKRKKAARLVARFCPFCGAEYTREASEGS